MTGRLLDRFYPERVMSLPTCFTVSLDRFTSAGAVGPITKGCAFDDTGSYSAVLVRLAHYRSAFAGEDD